MPVLPSGLSLALYKDHIMEPDLNWFKAPEGHFWFWEPDETSIPPFLPEDEVMRKPATAPVPTSREEMASFIQVLFHLDDGRYYWRGETLDLFPLYGSLSDEDMAAWKAWLDTDQVKDFLDQAIMDCRMQAEINKDAIGWAVIKGVTASDDNEDTYKGGYKVIDNPLKDAQ